MKQAQQNALKNSHLNAGTADSDEDEDEDDEDEDEDENSDEVEPPKAVPVASK